jgi:hypothetical protein
LCTFRLCLTKPTIHSTISYDTSWIDLVENQLVAAHIARVGNRLSDCLHNIQIYERSDVLKFRCKEFHVET